MAKNMARIDSGVVVNIEWWSDSTEDTETLISVYDRPVAAGDSYEGGKFYRDGVEVLTRMEELQAEIDDMQNALNALGVNA
jgi:hypothetical protein